MTITPAGWKYLLDNALVGVTEPGIYVAVITADFDEDASLRLADITVDLTPYTGGDAQLLTWGNAKGAGCSQQSAAVPAVLACTSAPGSPVVVYGYALLDSAAGPVPGTTLLGLHKFDAPNTIAAVGDAVAAAPTIALQCAG